MKKNFFSLFLLISLLVPSAAFAQAVSISKAERQIAEGITADQLKNYLYFIASDAMEGRNTPSRGLDITAEFIKMNLASWGLKPAGDNGTYFQNMSIVSDSVDTDASFVEIGGTKFTYANDFFRLPGSTGDMSNKPVVFAKDGWVINSKNINAFEGIDVRGKIVALYGEGQLGRQLIPLPAGVTPADLKGERGKDWSDGLSYAAENGAAGVILLPSKAVRSNWTALSRFFGRGGSYVEKLHTGPRGMTVPIPAIIISEAAANKLFEGQPANPLLGTADKAFTLDGKQVVTNIIIKSEKTPTQNVVAIWEGSDPVLKNEMVAVGAHYDHVGVNENAPGEDKIWNGADDDGSGTVAVLAIAEALAKAKTRPKRSILFVWHAGEEKGLWGSDYFTKFPTVDLKQVVAQLNIDMIGRSLDPANVIKCDKPGKRCNEELSKANEIYVIGSEMMSSTLGAITKGTNDQYLKMDYNYKYDDPKDPNRFFFRSDHFHYAANGIPIAFWFDGVHEDYHQASDHADKIDYAKMEKVSRTILLTLWELGSLKNRPVVDKQLPPELTER